MKRLTNNKPVSEMSMYELAHNSCYAKDRKARVRDFENDFDARELAIKLLEKYADIPNEFTCDEDFDEFILDSLQYGTDDILGLVAVFYQNLWTKADLRERLKKYEDLEEQGKLLKLPCAVGDTVYVLTECENIPFQLDGTLYGKNGEPGTATGYYCPYEDNCPFDDEDFEDCEKYKGKTAIFEDTVGDITVDEDGIWIRTENCGVCSQIGLYIFLTKEEAETALKKYEH